MSFFYSMRERRMFLRAVVCLVAVVAGMVFSRPELDAAKAWLFCRPAALAIAALTGGGLSFSGDEAIIITPGLRLVIPPSCSGFNFFLILAVSLLWVVPRRWATVIPAAYIIALVANSVRIIAVSRWEIHFAPYLPLPLPLQHMAVGMLVFLPTLLVIYLLTVYQTNYKRKPEHGN